MATVLYCDQNQKGNLKIYSFHYRTIAFFDWTLLKATWPRQNLIDLFVNAAKQSFWLSRNICIFAIAFWPIDIFYLSERILRCEWNFVGKCSNYPFSSVCPSPILWILISLLTYFSFELNFFDAILPTHFFLEIFITTIWCDFVRRMNNPILYWYSVIFRVFVLFERFTNWSQSITKVLYYYLNHHKNNTHHCFENWMFFASIDFPNPTSFKINSTNRVRKIRHSEETIYKMWKRIPTQIWNPIELWCPCHFWKSYWFLIGLIRRCCSSE